MRILVTGAAGFMGSHLFDHLRDLGHEVIGIDNYSLGEYRHKDIIELDLLDAMNVNALVQDFKPEILFHLAAWAHEGLSQFSPIKITENNYNAYLNVLIPCIRNRIKRVVCCSSMSVYGEGIPPFNEDDKRNPVDVYAVAKTSMEMTTEILSEVHDFEYTIVRPHNVYGPRQNISDPYRNVVGIFINRILNGQPPIIYGDGEQTRAFTYIDDITPYLAKCGFLENCKGQIINLGPVKSYSINQLSTSLLNLTDSRLFPIHLDDRPKEVKHAYCSNDKAKELLGYKETISLEDGLKSMLKWAKSIEIKPFKYLGELELTNDKTPKTWSERKM